MKAFTRFFALLILFFFGGLILYLGRDFILPILAAVIFSFLFFPLYKWILKKSKSEIFSASSVIIIFLLLIFIPISALIGMFISELNSFGLSEETILEYEYKVEEVIGIDLPILETVHTIRDTIRQDIRGYAQTIFSITSTVALALLIMFFTMFYLLVEHKKFLEGLKYALPFSKKNSEHLITQSGSMIKAVLIGQVLTAVIQGTLGMISFFIAGIEGAFFWGIIMIILSLIPVVGSFLVWVPAGLLLFIEGDVGMAIFVLVWGALVVSQVDNLVRPKLVNKFADIHPLETFLGIFIGLSAFGMIGIIIGPLLLALFKVLVTVYIKEYRVTS